MPRLFRDFDPVEPLSQRWFYFDFTDELGPGETIQTQTFTCTLVRGNDPTPQNRVLSVPVVIGNQIGALCGNFVADSWYSLEATAYTSAGNVLPNNARVYCQGQDNR